MKGNPSAMRPWADLPEPLAVAIMDLLPLVDYIRFGSVCKGWQSIRKEHRPRHPMRLPFPWFVSRAGLLHRNDNNNAEEEEEGFLESCSPLENKHRRLPLPPGLRRSRDIICHASCRGWLLMSSNRPYYSPETGDFPVTDDFIEPLLFNPVTRATIPLPRLFIRPALVLGGALSTPPTDPECTVLFIAADRSAFLHRLKDGGGNGWMRFASRIHYGRCSVTACGGKFYCHYLATGHHVGVIDPLLPQPTVQFNMIWHLGIQSAPPASPCCVVDNDGDACMVAPLILDHTIKLRVFRADLSMKKWVRVETLGDRAMFLDSPKFDQKLIFADWCCAFSFVAADVGLKKNTIYCSRYNNDSLCCWRAFDLDSDTWVDGTHVSCTNVKVGSRFLWANCWFVPTLDWIGTKQTNR